MSQININTERIKLTIDYTTNESLQAAVVELSNTVNNLLIISGLTQAVSASEMVVDAVSSPVEEKPKRTRKSKKAAEKVEEPEDVEEEKEEPKDVEDEEEESETEEEEITTKMIQSQLLTMAKRGDGSSEEAFTFMKEKFKVSSLKELKEKNYAEFYAKIVEISNA